MLLITAGVLLIGVSVLLAGAPVGEEPAAGMGVFRATLTAREIALFFGVLAAVVGADVGWLVFLGAYVDAR